MNQGLSIKEKDQSKPLTRNNDNPTQNRGKLGPVVTKYKSKRAEKREKNEPSSAQGTGGRS